MWSYIYIHIYIYIYIFFNQSINQSIYMCPNQMPMLFISPCPRWHDPRLLDGGSWIRGQAMRGPSRCTVAMWVSWAPSFHPLKKRIFQCKPSIYFCVFMIIYVYIYIYTFIYTEVCAIQYGGSTLYLGVSIFLPNKMGISWNYESKCDFRKKKHVIHYPETHFENVSLCWTCSCSCDALHWRSLKMRVDDRMPMGSSMGHPPK